MLASIYKSQISTMDYKVRCRGRMTVVSQDYVLKSVVCIHQKLTAAETHTKARGWELAVLGAALIGNNLTEIQDYKELEGRTHKQEGAVQLF